MHQYDALKADVRDYDKLIWGTPAISGAITGVILNLAFSKSQNCQDLPREVRLSILLIGILVNFALFHGLIKHRFFQVYKNEIINKIESLESGRMIAELKKTACVYASADNRLHGGLYQIPSFWSLAATQAVLFASLVAAFAYILQPSIAVAVFVLTLLVLCVLVDDP